MTIAVYDVSVILLMYGPNIPIEILRKHYCTVYEWTFLIHSLFYHETVILNYQAVGFRF